MMERYNIEVNDENGNVYYPHSKSEVVFRKDGSTVESALVSLQQGVDTASNASDALRKDLADTNKELSTKVTRSNALDDCELAPKSTTQNSAVNADLMFYLNDSRNQQGLTYAMNHFYVGFDVGNNSGDIVKYTKGGIRVASTGTIGIGHAAGLGFRESNGKIYVANGGGKNPTHVYEVDFDGKRVTRDINMEKYGTSALLAIDNANDKLILHTAPSGGDTGEILFTVVDFNGNQAGPQFRIPNVGVPQGLEYYNDILYYYTNDKVTCIRLSTQKILGSFSLGKYGESEGITLVRDGASTYLAVGYNNSNRIYSVRPQESQNFITPSLYNPIYRNSDSTKVVVPKILAFTLKQLNSDPATNKWIFEDWDNGSGQSVKSLFEGEPVTGVDNDQINVTLKTPFYSVASFFGVADWDLVREGVTAGFDIGPDGKSIRIAFRRNNTWVKLNELPKNSDVRCLIIGGVDINY